MIEERGAYVKVKNSKVEVIVIQKEDNPISERELMVEAIDILRHQAE